MHDTVCIVEVQSPTQTGSVFYSVAGFRDIPLSEVFLTHCEKTGKAPVNCKFLLPSGEVAPLQQTLGEKKRMTVIFIETGVEWREKERIFFQMNKLAASLNIKRSGDIGIPLSSELLDEIFSYLDLPSLFQCSCVSVYWHLLAQQRAMLTQLRLGLFAWHSKLNYPSWLAQMGDIAWNLAMSTVEHQAMVRDRWASLSLTKESSESRGLSREGARAHQFTKAWGCRLVPSVEEIPADCKSIRHSDCTWYGPVDDENKQRVKFLKQIKNQVMVTMKNGEVPVNTNCTDDLQQYPEPGSFGFVTRAYHQRYYDIAIQLYRSYFSPNMYYIFPLMVYQQQQFLLDFTDTETWIIFGRIPTSGPMPGRDHLPWAWQYMTELPESMPLPYGSVTWRFRRPILNISGYGNEKPVSVLEVLFIAVWEEERNHRLGSTLVRHLEENARSNGASFMYVEIGFEQAQAKDFWGMNGFKPAFVHNEPLPAEMSPEDICWLTPQQKFFCDSMCLRFADTEPYMKAL